MKKLIALVFILILLIPTVLADGMIIDPYGPVLERGQVAVINFEEGIQKMLLGISADNIKGDKAVWIFPVPAVADDVAIDIIPNMPRLRGREVTSSAKSTIDNLLMSVRYPLILPWLFARTFRLETFSQIGEKSDFSISGGNVVIYEHIEKEGMITELVGAEDGREIYLYLANKGLEVTWDSVPVLRDYADQEFTFVLSWFSNMPERLTVEEMTRRPYNYRTLGLEVIFPSNKPYYPMKPTSIYGSEKVPATIFLFGGYKPILYDKIESFVDTGYYLTYGNNLEYERELETFYGKMVQEIPEGPGRLYTLVNIRNVPSKFFEEDLWFEEDIPKEVGYSISVLNFLKNDMLLSLLLVAILSVAIAGLLGLLFFREDWWKFIIVGLFNILTIIPFIVAVLLIRTGKLDKKLKKQIKEAGYAAVSRDWLKKLGFMVAFIVIYLLAVWAIGGILKIPL